MMCMKVWETGYIRQLKFINRCWWFGSKCNVESMVNAFVVILEWCGVGERKTFEEVGGWDDLV